MSAMSSVCKVFAAPTSEQIHSQDEGKPFMIRLQGLVQKTRVNCDRLNLRAQH